MATLISTAGLSRPRKQTKSNNNTEEISRSSPRPIEHEMSPTVIYSLLAGVTDYRAWYTDTDRSLVDFVPTPPPSTFERVGMFEVPCMDDQCGVSCRTPTKRNNGNIEFWASSLAYQQQSFAT